MHHTYLIGILCLLIIIFVYHMRLNNGKTPTKTILNSTNNAGFVKPEHNLSFLLHNLSSGDKITLEGECEINYYTEHTTPTLLKFEIKKIMNHILNKIHDISHDTFSIDDILNIYEQIDIYGNKRYIIDSRILNVTSYYTIRLIFDIVVYNSDIYINYIHINTASSSNLINRYDRVDKQNGAAILDNVDTFGDGIRNILDGFYIPNFNVVGIEDDSNYKIDNVLTLNSMSKFYFPSSVNNSSIKSLEEKNLDGLVKMYVPQDISNIESVNFCNKETNEWNHQGYNLKNNKECPFQNNQTTSVFNRPYNRPGVLFNRSGINIH